MGIKVLSLKTKLTISFCILIAFLGISIFIGYKTLNRANEIIKEMYEDNYTASVGLSALHARLNAVRAALVTMLFEAERPKQEAQHKIIKDLTKGIDLSFEQLINTPRPQRELSILTEARESWIAFRDTRDSRLIPAIYAGRIDEARALALGIQKERYERFFSLTKKLVEMETKEMEEAVEFSRRQYRNLLISFVIIGFLSVSASIVMAIFLIKGIATPVLEIARGARRIANGDLETVVEVSSKDEIGILATTFNNMAASLKQSSNEQKRLYGEEQRKVRQIAVLHEAVTAIASELELKTLLYKLASHAASLLQSELCALVVLHPTTGETQHFRANIPPDEFPVKTMAEGKGLLGVVLKEGKTLRLDDVTADSRSEGLPSGHPFLKILLGIPMFLKGKIIGGVFVANKKGGETFTQEDEALLRMFTLQSATAIENARLYDAARQRAERIAAINRLTRIISASLDIGAVYEAFAAELRRFISYTRMGIVIPEDSGQQLRLFQLAGDRSDNASVGRVWSNGKGTGVKWVMTHKRPHFEPDLAKAGRFVEDGALVKEGIRSTVRLPLIVKGQVIGVLFLDDVAPDRYTERDLELLVPLGEQLAIAIENARLHGEMERKVEERTRALRQTQAQLIQSGKLAAVGTLAAGVAHELNQPLMIMRGYAQELIEDRRIADEEIRDDLRRIEAQTTRMTAIINHLRDFSRQSKGKRQVTDLNRVVQDALTFLVQQLNSRNIVVVRELDPALPTVRIDPLQIEQVLLNLITNARDAMESAKVGTITVRTECAQGSRVALSVTDTGPGVPEEIRTRIFDPFFTTKEVGKGTGLGLSICHGIVEEHEGELTMESPIADGRGARFIMTLPQTGRDDQPGDQI